MKSVPAWMFPILVLALAGCGGPPQQTGTPEPAPAGAPPAVEAEAPKPTSPAEMIARGVFLGRGGKPMAKARLMLGEISGDDVFRYARIRLVAKVATAVADAEGKFEFKGFTPGAYTIVYQPAGSAGIVPVEIPIRTLSGTTDSIAPLLRGFELGRETPFGKRPWGTYFTLLEGHTLYSDGPKMRIWNATARYTQGGVHVEMRRGEPWTARLDAGSEIRFEAWSF